MVEGTSPVVQWLRLHLPMQGSVGMISGQGKKIPHAARSSQKSNNNPLEMVEGRKW